MATQPQGGGAAGSGCGTDSADAGAQDGAAGDAEGRDDSGADPAAGRCHVELSVYGPGGGSIHSINHMRLPLAIRA